MPSSKTLVLGLCAAAAGLVEASPLLDQRQTPNPAQAPSYAPQPATCPSTPIVRAADGLSAPEAAYVAGRKPVCDQALSSWLSSIDSGFEMPSRMPLLGLASSGGGYRALLAGAGVLQGLDARDTDAKTGGLFQAMTYHVGLSGGAWLVAAIAANGWPTISSQMNNLWVGTINTGMIQTALDPLHHRVLGYEQEMWEKKRAGFEIQIADPWGSILGDQLVYEQLTDYSAIGDSAEFRNFTAPLPILTATQVNRQQGQCYPSPSSLQYEISPFEFGSWDAGLHSFAQTKFLGSTVEGDHPSKCITGYDKVSYVMGTASNLFNGGCHFSDSFRLPGFLENLVTTVTGQLTNAMTFANYPNPFYRTDIAQVNSNVSSVDTLRLVDDGETTQNNPLWPFIQPQRPVDVVFVNDNGGNRTHPYPNGTEMHSSYLRAQQAGLTRMPEFPDPVTFQPSLGRAWFFGCHNPDQVTLIYIPNRGYSFESDLSTYLFQVDSATSIAMVKNGVDTMTQGNDEKWPMCLACGIMQKAGGKMPDHCHACLKHYCYN